MIQVAISLLTALALDSPAERRLGSGIAPHRLTRQRRSKGFLCGVAERSQIGRTSR